MTMPDPLEPLREHLAKLREWGLQEQFFFKQLKDMPADMMERTLGDIGALFAHFDDLRRANEQVLKEQITQGEVEVRREIATSLNQLLHGLEEFRNSLPRFR